MQKDDLIKFREGLNPPEIELPGYTRRLRKALLASSNFQNRRTVDFLALNNILKEIFMLKKTIIFTGIVCAMVVALVLGTGLFLNNVSHAQAQDVITKAMDTVEKISPDEFVYLEKKLGVSLQMTLKEAKAAPDLTILNENEIKDVFGSEIRPEDEMGCKFVRYTDLNGKTVVMGLDQNDIPVFMLIKLGDQECISVMKSKHAVDDSNLINLQVDYKE